MSAGWSDAIRVLRNRTYRLMLVGELVSLSGSTMQATALSWLVFRLTGSTALLGAIMFLIGIPLLFIGPLSGGLVERFGAKRVFLVTEGICFAHATLLFWLTRADMITPGRLLVLAGVLGVVSAIDLPAQQAIVVGITSAADRQAVFSINATLLQATRVIGPSAAALVVSTVGEATCFLLNGLTFLFFILCVLPLRMPPSLLGSRSASPLGQLADAVRYLRRAPDVADLVWSVGLANLVAAPTSLLLPFYAERVLGLHSRGFGLLAGATGLGAVFGTLLLARYQPTPRRSTLLETAFVVIGAAFSAFAWSPFAPLSVVLLAFIGFVLVPRNVMAFVRMQSLVPEQYRVRVSALNLSLNVGLIPIANIAAGELATVVDPQLVVALSGVACLGVALLFRMRRTARLRG